jgi:hypothetical protein
MIKCVIMMLISMESITIVALLIATIAIVMAIFSASEA